ncbi:MAG: hypothetical protein FJX75_16820 [Armatimonadetes bacterium]|nr:hypothetical protein [Armatimonadota bacterium]
MGQAAEDPRNPSETGRDHADVLRSVGAALLGVGVAAAMAFTVLHLLHPGPWGLLVGVPVVCALVPGHVIGLIDRRRPAVTATVAVVVFSFGLLGALGGYSDPDPGPFWLAGVVAWLVALLGAAWSHRTRRPMVGAALLSGLYVTVSVVPEALAWQACTRFVHTRIGDVRAFTAEEVVRTPAGLLWQYEPRGGIFQGVELRAGWAAAPSSIGSGRCDLVVTIRSRQAHANMAAMADQITVGFRPSIPSRVRTRAEAEAALRELGVPKPLEPLTKSIAQTWRAT